MSNRVLLIDDDPAFREMISIALTDTFPEIKIYEARDGHVGVKKLEENKFDIILLDYRLPFGMSGLRFLERTQELRRGIPLIMISAQGNEEIAAKAFRLGATDYLVKTQNLMDKLVSMMKDIFESDHSTACQDPNEPPLMAKANLDKANSGIELVKQCQEELNNIDSHTSLRGETMLMEFDEINEFNKFSRLVKFLRGVKIKDTKILESRYVILLSLLPTRYQRIRVLS